MVIRISQDSPLWIRADLIKPNGTRKNLYSKSIHPYIDINAQFDAAEDSVRFNYPELSSVPIDRQEPLQAAQESI